ncbi:fructose-bisphosphate aldolase 1, chloroplastic [Haematococcus lacustris]|uniref:fructose-bisphosphate aldolase n=1 Tax=Haematococcus lacustris TaxID=44745 RepID=A0A699YL31_HAELA|nr:fructose-bisphosphate aldolase 1, chloroplastic [Haematococcus lacustris]
MRCTQSIRTRIAEWCGTLSTCGLVAPQVLFEGILLKPAMVTPGADCPNRASPTKVAEYTLKLLKRRVPPAVPGIMFLSGGQSELEATLNLNEMNKSPNPWHVSFSYARALQNSVLKTWQGKPENVAAAQEALLKRAKANSEAQLGKYDPASEGTTEAAKSLYEKGYKFVECGLGVMGLGVTAAQL